MPLADLAKEAAAERRPAAPPPAPMEAAAPNKVGDLSAAPLAEWPRIDEVTRRRSMAQYIIRLPSPLLWGEGSFRLFLSLFSPHAYFHL